MGHIFRVSAPNVPKTLKLGQTKARNGFRTLKRGGGGGTMGSGLGTHLCRPKSLVVGSRGRCVRARAFVPRGPRQARARTFRETPHGGLRVNKSGSQGLKNMVSPYFEGAGSIPGTSLARFQGFNGFLGRKPAHMSKIGSKPRLVPPKSAESTKEILGLHTFPHP